MSAEEKLAKVKAEIGRQMDLGISVRHPALREIAAGKADVCAHLLRYLAALDKDDSQ